MLDKCKEDEKEIERLRGELEFAKGEMRRYIRKSQVLEAQVNAWRKALEWYASPAHWVEQVDDRGRETLRWRWADDDGRMARHALDSWKERSNGKDQGATETAGGQGGEADADSAASAGND